MNRLSLWASAVLICSCTTGYIEDLPEVIRNPEPIFTGSKGNLPSARQEAMAILQRSCTPCHGGQALAPDVSSEDSLIKTGFVLPGNPKESPLITALAPTGNMPKGRAPLTAQEIQTLNQWIVGLAQDKSAIVSEAQVLNAIKRDLIERVSPLDRQTVRYFSLHVANNRQFSQAEMKSLREGLVFLINSLSWAEGIVQPVPVDENNLVYRLNLADLKMATADFDAVMKDYYPFSTVNAPLSEAFEDAQLILDSTKSKFPFVRGDWFVATAPLPTLYARLLMPTVAKKPGTALFELEKLLGVDVKKNISVVKSTSVQGKVLRSGFKQSGVSAQNRMIERHGQLHESGRAFWISYDFGPDVGNGDLFLHPFSSIDGVADSTLVFKHDGGEVIFELPNGLFGYFLATSDGKSIDRGPKEIVKQNNGTGPEQLDNAIVNGLSCMNCHASGLIYKKDEIADHFKAKPLASDLRAFLQALYVGDDVFKKAMDADNSRYQIALSNAGLAMNSPGPIDASFRSYNRSLTRAEVLVELDIGPELLDSLLYEAPFNSKWVSLKQGNLLRREEFNPLFRQAIMQTSTRTAPPPSLGDVLVKTGCLENSLLFEKCLVAEQ